MLESTRMAGAEATTTNMVLVTGASGFVALHCVRRLLLGPYRVRGTVRSLKNEKKVEPLRRLPFAAEKLELVEADLLQPDNWTEVLAGCTFVLHVASPWLIVADSSIIRTAVDGTLTVLRAAAARPEIQKVVLTSSCTAVNDGHKNSERVFDETCWTRLKSAKVDFYARSKTLAERAAWDYWYSLPEDSRFELTVLNPTLVFGPVLSDVEHGCATILARMMSPRTSPAHPKASLGLVDVHNVAEAHVRCLEPSRRQATNGERILVTARHSAWYSDIATWLHEEFAKHGYTIPTWETPTWLLRLYASTGFDPEARAVVARVGKELRFENRKSRRLLGMTYRDVRSSVVEMMHSMIAHGMVRETKAYLAARTAHAPQTRVAVTVTRPL